MIEIHLHPEQFRLKRSQVQKRYRLGWYRLESLRLAVYNQHLTGLLGRVILATSAAVKPLIPH